MPSRKDTLKTPWRQPLNSSNWRENSPTPPPPMSTPTLAPHATPCHYTQATFPIGPATLTLFDNPGNCTCQVVPIVPLMKRVTPFKITVNNKDTRWSLESADKSLKQGHSIENVSKVRLHGSGSEKKISIWLELWFGKLWGKNDRFFLNALFHRSEQRSLCQI